LGLVPTDTVQKGIKIGKRTGFPMQIPKSGWLLSSEDNEASMEFERHLDWLLDKLVPVRTQLRAIADRPDTKMYCDGIGWTDEPGGFIALGVTQMQRLVELGLQLGIQFADYGSDE